MSRLYLSELSLETIRKDASDGEYADLLSRITDDDFNGENGKEYYVEHDGKKMSKLNVCMEKFDDYEDKSKFVSDSLKYFYDSDCYYEQYKIETRTIGEDIVIATTSMTW